MIAITQLQAIVFALLAAFVLTSAASQAFPAAAASLNLGTKHLFVDTDNVEICDHLVNVSAVDNAGVVASVEVSGISASCLGWTLYVRVTTAANAPAGSELSAAVDSATETFDSLSINAGAGYKLFSTFEAP